MKFKITKEIFKKYPSTKIALLIVKDINNEGKSEELQKELKKNQELIRSKLNLQTLVDNPKINDWRKAYSSFGSKPKTYKNSVEALLKRILKGDNLPDINKIVNIYNMISIKHILPAGGDNLDEIKGNINLDIAKENEKFTILGSNKNEIVTPGEVIYKDDKEVLCRKWNWRECDKTKMKTNTKNVCLVIRRFRKY